MTEPLPPVSQGALFGAGRAAGLKRPTPPPSPSTSTASTDEASGRATVEQPSTATRSSIQDAKPTRTRKQGGVAPQPKVVHLAEAVAQALRTEAAKSRGVSLSEVTLQAIERAHPNLDQILPAQRPAGDGGLFERQVSARVRPRLRREQVTLRLTPHNDAVLDQLASEHGVSRSDLVERVLANHFQISLTDQGES